MNESNFYYMLWANLVAMCKKDTGNMSRNIWLDDYGDYFLITISGPNLKYGYDYAEAVNYGLAAKAQGRTRSYKEELNYMWVERTVEQTKASMGVEVECEIY